MPEVFTGTPIEAHMVAVFMQGQLAFAQLIRGTPVFRNILFWVLAWVMVLKFLDMAAHKHAAGRAFTTIIYRLVLVYVALAMLGRQYENVQWSSTTSGAWSNRTGVNADPRYASTIGAAGRTPGLVGYVWIYSALNNIAQVMTTATANAFGAPALARDPGFLHKQLARMGSMALPPALRTQFDSLLKNCSNTNTGRITGAYDGLREWLNLTTPDCADEYAAFEASARVEGQNLVLNQYPQYVGEQMAAELVRRGLSPAGVPPMETLGNIAIANALFKSVVDREGRKEMGYSPNQWFGARNQNANGAATFSDGIDRATEESANGFIGNFGFMNMFDAVASLWGGSTYRATQKAAAANWFNQYAPLIPAARGFAQGLLAILFVLAAYSVGFGTWRWMYKWIYAQAMLCLYKPIAVLGFRVAEYFTQEQKATEAISNMASSPLVLSGVKILNDQVPRIQTVYLGFEIGAFFMCVVAAIAAFKPLEQMGNDAATRIAGSVQAGVQRVAGAALGGAGGAAAGGGAANVLVNVNRGVASGTGATGGPAVPSSGSGLIVPSAPPSNTWGQAS